MTTRTVSDSMGTLEVPETALYGAQTARAVQNFPISGKPMPRDFIEALGLVKWSAAKVNEQLGLLASDAAQAIQAAALAVAAGEYDEHFPVDVYQTGSGTSSNMNANEVIATLASQSLGKTVHPNDLVNMGQSSNDVIPTALHVSARLSVHRQLLPALNEMDLALTKKRQAIGHITKTGRTHLMDAMPVTFDQELSGWQAQLKQAGHRIESLLPEVAALAQGGTAVGTGVNAHPEFAGRFATAISEKTGVPFTATDNPFMALSSQDTLVALSGQFKALSVAIMKIANDLRWMNSGPLTGLSEIALPALQPGSSIMPGKVNPVVCESAMMASAQVMGLDTAIMVAGQHGNFQLNVMLPMVAANILESVTLLTQTLHNLRRHAIEGFEVQSSHIEERLGLNPILVTALNARIGYELGAQIAKAAYASRRPILDVASEMTDLSESELKQLLNPEQLTRGGLPG